MIGALTRVHLTRRFMKYSTTLYKREILNFVHLSDKSRYRALPRYDVHAISDVRYTSNFATISTSAAAFLSFSVSYTFRKKLSPFVSYRMYIARAKLNTRAG